MRVIKSGGVVLGLSLLSGTALANCFFDTGSAAVFTTMPLVGNSITVGRDVQLGSEVYKQRFRSSTPLTVLCNDVEGAIIQNIRTFPVTPLPLSSWTGNDGKVYQTGVPGIGVVVTTNENGKTWPYTDNFTKCGANGTCIFNMKPTAELNFSFIKIGNVSPGTIQGASLPTLNLKIVSPNGQSLEFMTMNTSGSLNVVSRTCSTPDIQVPMGTHTTSEFAGQNTFTAWKDFAIVLNDCPAFNGYFKGTPVVWESNGTISGQGARWNNALQVRLDPTRAAITPRQGIMSLDPAPAGVLPAASGIGLQVADGQGAPMPLATLLPSGINPLPQDGNSYSIPLKARYIQTGSSITAGPANASATFTINYD